MIYEPSVIITPEGKEIELDSLTEKERTDFFIKQTIKAFEAIGMKPKKQDPVT